MHGREQGRHLLGAGGAAVLPRGEPAAVHRVPHVGQLRGGRPDISRRAELPQIFLLEEQRSVAICQPSITYLCMTVHFNRLFLSLSSGSCRLQSKACPSGTATSYTMHMVCVSSVMLQQIGPRQAVQAFSARMAEHGIITLYSGGEAVHLDRKLDDAENYGEMVDRLAKDYIDWWMLSKARIDLS